MNVLAMPGSLRRDSYNRRLLMAATTCAPPGMTVTVAACDLLASIPPFNEDVEAAVDGDPEPVRELRRQVRAADGLLISTPEYNQSMPGVLKNIIDWLSRPRPDEVLVGKPAAIMGATSGTWGTRLSQSMTRQVLTSTECVVLPPAPAIYLANVQRLFNEAGELVDGKIRERLGKFLVAFGDWMTRFPRVSPAR